MRNRRALWIGSGIILLLAAALTVCLIFLYAAQSRNLPARGQRASEESFRRHYAFVCENSQEDLYRAIYEAASERAAENRDYLELIGEDLTTDFSRDERMEIAVDAAVDGIIVMADETEEMTALIDRADAKGIPVITVGRDNTASARKSFVGFGFYDLGQSFAKQILRNVSDDPKDVLVLLSSDTEGSAQNIIFQGIRETIDRLD
ncbi:MAG: substrate-binding domain-containing protein, partial [Lachnospiraceae bacterium]|nr:substrate-binding domain-containing protein [Lachnospiraceae bacterium]